MNDLELARSQIAWVRSKLEVATKLARHQPWMHSLFKTLMHAIDIDHPLLRHLYTKDEFMTQNDFNKFTADFFLDQGELLLNKGQDYAGDGDRLANFKRLAKGLGLTPLQIWAVYFTKHVDALVQLAKTGSLKSEPPRGRFLDVANYAILGAALFAESEPPSTLLERDNQEASLVETLDARDREIEAHNADVKAAALDSLAKRTYPAPVAERGDTMVDAISSMIPNDDLRPDQL